MDVLITWHAVPGGHDIPLILSQILVYCLNITKIRALNLLTTLDSICTWMLEVLCHLEYKTSPLTSTDSQYPPLEIILISPL